MTRDDTDGRARRGYLILTGIFLAAVLIFNLKAVYDLAGDRMDLVALLPSASGVRVGTPVRVAGVQAGRVTGVSLLTAAESADVAVNVRVEGEGIRVIRLDSDVRAVRMRVIGQPVIEIHAGTAAAPAATDGDTLHAASRVGPDPMVLWEDARRLPQSLDSLMTAARTVAEMARSRQPELALLQERVEALNGAAGVLSANLEGGSLGPLLAPDGMAAVGRLRSRLDSVAVAVDAAMARYRGTEEAPAAMTASLVSLRERVATLRVDLDQLRARLEEGGGGILYRLPRDSAIEVAIRGVQAQIDSVRAEAGSIVLRMFLPIP